MNDSHQRYDRITRFFHWGMALLIFWEFLQLGGRINDGEHWVGRNLAVWHVSIGAVLLPLVVLRIGWTLRQRSQRPQHVGAKGMLVKAGHFLLYLVMALVPVTGVLYMVGNGYGLTVFGAQLIAGSETKVGWMISLGNLHSPLALVFVALVVGHIAAALYHRFVSRDGTLERMLGD